MGKIKDNMFPPYNVTKNDIEKVQHLADAIKEELRSIIRQWDKLHKPLRCSEKVSPFSEGSPRYRIEGAQSFEELEELILRFAGSVWHLKDRLNQWVKIKELKEIAANGEQKEISIEQMAKESQNLLLCADLYNMKKHGKFGRNPKTTFSPILNGVSFDTTKSNVIGICYDGASKMGDILATNPELVPYRVEILSGDHKRRFGNAVVVITRGFGYWIPLLRQLGILRDDLESKWIMENLSRVEEYIKQTDPFKPG
jgi:hypothetical protein